MLGTVTFWWHKRIETLAKVDEVELKNAILLLTQQSLLPNAPFLHHDALKTKAWDAIH